MRFDNSFFSITPETFKSIDVDLSSGKAFSMIYPKMSISTEHQGIITSEPIRINNRPSSYCFYCITEYFLSSDIFQDFNFYGSFPLKNTKHRNLIPGTSSSFPFTFTSKIGFICLYFTSKKKITIKAMSGDGHLDDIKCLQHSGTCLRAFTHRQVGYSHLYRCLSGIYFQLKELYQPQPVLAREVELANPF